MMKKKLLKIIKIIINQVNEIVKESDLKSKILYSIGIYFIHNYLKNILIYNDSYSKDFIDRNFLFFLMLAIIPLTIIRNKEIYKKHHKLAIKLISSVRWTFTAPITLYLVGKITNQSMVNVFF